MASHAARIAGYGQVATALSLRSDRRLGDLVDAAPLIGSGIGGTAVRLEIEGTPVFAKRVPLTDLERRPSNVLSTANLFGLPTFYQYGVGSAGFGVWRELAAHVMTTNWVLDRQCESFPLLYHWRVLPGSPAPPPADELDRTVAYWDGSPTVRERLAAIAGASASVVLFLEYLPQTLRDWLTEHLDGSACALVEQRLETDIAFLVSHGFVHFDAHFNNVLTDGERLYFADFGLATSPRFELSTEETDFLARNMPHDRCHTVTELVNFLVRVLVGPPDRNAYIRACAEGGEPAGLPAWAAATVQRYAPVAAVVNEFYWTLHRVRRTVPFPAEDVDQAWATVAAP